MVHLGVRARGQDRASSSALVAGRSIAHRSTAPYFAMPQLTVAEMGVIDGMVRSERKRPLDAWRALTTARQQIKVRGRKLKGPSKAAVYNYINGHTHKRNKDETRGRHAILTRADVRKLMQARRRLIKSAAGESAVTYAMIMVEASLDKDVSKRVVEETLKAEGVRYRPARKKIYLTKKDAQVRKAWAQRMIRRPARYWAEEVHAFMDNKSWPLPLTAKQRGRVRAQKISGHLRLPSEGTEQGFTRPRTSHSFVGLPSINVCAAVAKDRVALWHECGPKWNGGVAAEVYRGPLLKALRRAWGVRESYQIVEDGDRKGWQSKKGITAKSEVGIRAITLPPRTPSLMPLDALIWNRIEKKMEETCPDGDESRADFIDRLQSCAKKLPRAFVQRSIARTRECIKAIIDAGGYHPKND